MKTRWINLFWGLGLILAGLVFMLQNLKVIPELSDTVWSYVLAVLSLLFFATYFLSGTANWGWLFPATILGGCSLTLMMVNAGWEGGALGAPVLAGVRIPFYVVFGLEPRKNWWASIPAWVMTVLTAVTFMAERVAGETIGALFLFSIGLPFLVVFLLNRKQWWALIPAWVMIVLSLVALLANQVPGETIGGIFMFAIGLPFLVIFLVNRAQKWALIPAFVMMVIGLIALISSKAKGEYIGAFVLFAIAVPFFVVYFMNAQQWWALVPAGVMTSVALLPLLTTVIKTNQANPPWAYGVLSLGIGLTFLVLWLRRAVHPTGWAVYPAVVLGLFALVAFFWGSQINIIGPILVIAFGVFLLFIALRPKKAV